jgi:ABC-type glycerol-3-phosphate transport system substrate-binding protein
MKTICKALGAGAVAVLLTACGGSPTGAAAETSTPSFDMGYGMGSGNREAPAGSTTSESVAADTTGRSGYTMGSGN